MQTTNSDFIDIMEKNHMEIPWHDYANDDSNVLIAEAGLIEKASVIGRVGLIMLSCGTGAWRVRTSMNRLSKELGVTCTVDVGLMSIVFNCFDGNDCVSQSLSIANTGVNTSKLYRMEQFVDHFPEEEAHMTGEDIHKRLDEIEEIHALYSPTKLGLAAALACCGFTFLLGGGPVEMALAFIAAGIGNLIRTKLIKHHYTLFLNIAVSVSAACFTYAVFLKLAELVFHIPEFHEAGYICSMLFIIPGFPFITSGIDLAKLDLRSGLERLTYAIIIVMVATLFAWIMALLLHLEPADFTALHLSAAARLRHNPEIINRTVQVKSRNHDHDRRHGKRDSWISITLFNKRSKQSGSQSPDKCGGGRRHMCEINKFKPECIGNGTNKCSRCRHRMRTVEHDRETEYSAKACNHTENQTGSST